MESSGETQNVPPVEVPAEALDDETLHALVESFVLREGTDYGSSEVSLDTKIAQIQRQMEKGDIKVVFDGNTETVTLMTANDFRKLSRAAGPV